MSGGSKSKEQTVGYRYYMGAHMILCHGPVDAITEIQVGERQAWQGTQNGSGRLNIYKPGLFGGDRREGGISGTLDIAAGESTQAVNDYLARQLGQPQPAYRGVLGLVLRQMYIAANNPYLKPWWVRARRMPKGWYPVRAAIGAAANPAHIIYECLTNGEWGMGYATLRMDDASFRAAADALHAEEFGLNLLWTNQTTIDGFIEIVLNHIGAAIRESPATGKFELKLFRNDYQIPNLTTFNPNNVIELHSFQRAAWGETVNEIVVLYKRADNFKDTSISVQDLANIQAQGAVVSQTKRYPGITDDALAAKVAARDLRQHMTPLAKVRMTVNRAGWQLQPGDVCKLSWPPLGITDLILRIGSVEGGTLRDGRITITALEDIFNVASTTYLKPQRDKWQPPSLEPAPAPHQRLLEVAYYDIATTLSPTELAAIDASDSFLATLAVSPGGSPYGYRILTKAASARSYTDRGTGLFCPNAQLTAALPASVSNATVNYSEGQSLDQIEVGGYAYINNEMFGVQSIDRTASTVTLIRGILDTVPAAHALGDRIWFANGFLGVDRTERTNSETVDAKLLPLTGLGSLPESRAISARLTMTGRQGRPYPPGNFKINGTAYPAQVSGDLTITWAHRSRIQQTARFITQTDGNVGPEAGVTYTLQIYGETGMKFKEWTGLTGTSQTYSVVQEELDAGMKDSVGNPRVNRNLTIEIFAIRDNLASWQTQTMSFDRIDGRF